MNGVSITLGIILSGIIGAGPVATPPVKEKCPVCGMFVHKYPDWTSTISFRSGKRFYFDGAKDLARFYWGLDRYAPGTKADDVVGMTVKDYYSLEQIDGRKAFYVLGSDVYGPMGKEFIPFASRDDAEGFRKDHHGSRVLTFREINRAILKLVE